MSRRRYRWDEETQRLVEIGSDYTGAERRAQTSTEELTYGGMQATDGTPINSRRKHREYLKQTGLTVASDYTNYWAKAQSEREFAYQGKSAQNKRELREAVGRAAYQLEKKGRR